MSDDYGNSQKLMAMLVLGVGSLATGMLPVVLPKMTRHHLPMITSLLLCLGAGILLATSLVHILPEARAQFLSNWAEITFTIGFFIIYFIDEFVHFICNGGQHRHHHQQQQINERQTVVFPTQYGAASTTSEYEAQPLLRQPNLNVCNCHSDGINNNTQSLLSTIGLLIALLLHSIIEGLAIGVQVSSAKVLILLGAVACHKFVMGFCLGLEFRINSQMNLRKHVIFVTLFAFGSVTGIAVGMLLVDASGILSNTLPVVQALAGGTLLYITVCEVIPREKRKCQQYQLPQRKILGIIQFFCIAAGFAIMCAINFYLNDDI